MGTYPPCSSIDVSLNEAKCNLGKVKLETMLASRYLMNVHWGGPIREQGIPGHVLLTVGLGSRHSTITFAPPTHS